MYTCLIVRVRYFVKAHGKSGVRIKRAFPTLPYYMRPVSDLTSSHGSYLTSPHQLQHLFLPHQHISVRRVHLARFPNKTLGLAATWP